jgi:hypothetical protein
MTARDTIIQFRAHSRAATLVDDLAAEVVKRTKEPAESKPKQAEVGRAIWAEVANDVKLQERVVARIVRGRQA